MGVRGKSKLLVAAAFIVAGLMLGRFAFAIIHDPFSPVIIIVAAILFLGGMFYFVKNFRE